MPQGHTGAVGHVLLCADGGPHRQVKDEVEQVIVAIAHDRGQHLPDVASLNSPTLGHRNVDGFCVLSRHAQE